MKAVMQKATSNADFGRRVGVHYTYASRIRNGQRRPSARTLEQIREAFDLDNDQTSEMLRAARTARGFGAWITEHLFDEPTGLDPRY